MFEVEDYLSTSSSAKKLLIEKIEGHNAEQKVKKLSTTSLPTAPTLPLSLPPLLWIWRNALFQFSLPTCEDLCSHWRGTYCCAEQSPPHGLQWFIFLSKYQNILFKLYHPHMTNNDTIHISYFSQNIKLFFWNHDIAYIGSIYVTQGISNYLKAILRHKITPHKLLF